MNVLAVGSHFNNIEIGCGGSLLRHKQKGDKITLFVAATSGFLNSERMEVRKDEVVIAGEEGSGIICLNGAAARMVSTGDKVSIMSYARMTPEEVKDNPPKVVFVDEENKITSVTRYEKHGALKEV